MWPHKMRDLSFQAELVCSAGNVLNVHCSIRVPIGGWDGANVDILVPEDAATLRIADPCEVTGVDGYGRTITLRGLYHRDIERPIGRRKGLLKMDVYHLDELRIMGRNPLSDRSRKLQFTLAAHEFLKGHSVRQRTLSPSQQTDELFSLDLPHLGNVTFFRVWNFLSEKDGLNGSAVLSFVLSVNSDEITIDPRQTPELIRNALAIPSIFWRQRVAVLGWEYTNENGYRVSIWNQPLDPVKPEKTALQPHSELVGRANLQEDLAKATRHFSELQPELQKLIELMGMGLVPYVQQHPTDRFLSLFHALEKCRKFATREPSAEVQAVTDELLGILRSAQDSSTGPVSDRLAGLVTSVLSGPKVDLKIQLEEIFAKWNIVSRDIWPLTGREKMPGLKQVRDRLSHSGSTAVNSTCLPVATFHLAVLVERIVLALLSIRVDHTEVSVQGMARDGWFDAAFVEEERRKILSQPDWA